MKFILKSKLFWASTLLIAAVIFAGLDNTNKSYQANTDIILVPTSDKTASQMNFILANTIQIPQSLSFYNEMVTFNGQFGNHAVIFPSYSRESDWTSKIDIRRQGNSSIIRLGVLDKNPAQAEALSQAAALNLTRNLSLLYNIKTELTSRIIGQSVTTHTLFYVISLLSAEAIISGFLITLIIFLLSDFLSDMITRNYFSKTPKIKIPDFTAPADVSESEPYIFSKPPEQHEEPKTSQLKPEITSEPDFFHSARAAAPDNLPVIDEASSFKMQPSQSEKPADISQLKKNSKVATPEEVKERLNKLLAGKM